MAAACAGSADGSDSCGPATDELVADGELAAFAVDAVTRPSATTSEARRTAGGNVERVARSFMGSPPVRSVSYVLGSIGASLAEHRPVRSSRRPCLLFAPSAGLTRGDMNRPPSGTSRRYESARPSSIGQRTHHNESKHLCHANPDGRSICRTDAPSPTGGPDVAVLAQYEGWCPLEIRRVRAAPTD